MQYLVNKDFIDFDGTLRRSGSKVVYETETDFICELVNHDFITPIKDQIKKIHKGDKYFIIAGLGLNIDETAYLDTSIDMENYVLGNFFQTKQEAEIAIQWLQAFKILRDDTRGFRPDGSAPYYTVDYQFSTNQLIVGRNIYFKSHLINFRSEDQALNSINLHRSEWLIYFGVN